MATESSTFDGLSSMNPMKFKAVLFDIDGTLIDSREFGKKIHESLFREYLNEPLTKENTTRFEGMPTRKILAELSSDHEKIMDECIRLSDQYRHMSHLFLGIQEVLDALKTNGTIMGIVTSQTNPELEGLRKYYQLEEFFRVWISSDDVSKPKPSPEPVLMALDALNVSPEQTLFIGDTFYDLEAGKKASVKVGLAAWGTEPTAELLAYEPDYVFRHPEEILQTCI